jgi:hypothetical protein
MIEETIKLQSSEHLFPTSASKCGKKIPACIAHEGSLPCLQKPIFGPYSQKNSSYPISPIPILLSSSHQPLRLVNVNLPTIIFIFSMRAIRPTQGELLRHKQTKSGPIPVHFTFRESCFKFSSIFTKMGNPRAVLSRCSNV